MGMVSSWAVSRLMVAVSMRLTDDVFPPKVDSDTASCVSGFRSSLVATSDVCGGCTWNIVCSCWFSGLHWRRWFYILTKTGMMFSVAHLTSVPWLALRYWMTIKTVKACPCITHNGVSLSIICHDIAIIWTMLALAEKACSLGGALISGRRENRCSCEKCSSCWVATEFIITRTVLTCV